MKSKLAAGSHYMPMNFLRDSPIIDRAQGRYLYATDGRIFLDGASGGVGAAIIGHAVTEIIEAISEQTGKVCHANASSFFNQPALELADFIIEHFAPPGMEKVYFVSTGTEATELCIKLARLYHVLKGSSDRFKIISRWGSYHGSSLAALSFSGRTTRRSQFHPYYFPSAHIGPAYYFRYGKGLSEEEYSRKCACELEDTIRREGPEYVSCFIAEPLVNTMGACPAPASYFKHVRDICNRYDVIMIVDEVVTGFGRTGMKFGIDNWGVVPDLIACGKGISGGYAPLAAAIVHEKVWKMIETNPTGTTVMGYTHAGNPLSSATSLAVLNYIKDNNLVQRANIKGREMMNIARSRFGSHPNVGDIRGMGMMMAFEFVQDRSDMGMYPPDINKAQEIYSACMQEGLSLCPVHGDSDGLCGDSLIIKPPLTILDEEISELFNKLSTAMRNVNW